MPESLKKNPKRRDRKMENNIELFDKYVLEELTSEETSDFESRLESDSDFAHDFRLYLYTIKGIQSEAAQDNIELGHALKRLSKEELNAIVGRKNLPKILRLPYLRERMAWASSVAALLIIGFFSIFYINRSDQNRYYDLIVEYNYVYAAKGVDEEKDITEMSDKEIKELIPALKHEYQSVPSDDMQAGEATGMRLAMAYLKIHDRKAAIEILEDMAQRYSDDVEFAAQCNKIISQLK